MSNVEALLEERRGYALHGRKDRVAQVDAELAKYGIVVDASEQERPTTATRTPPKRAVRTAPEVR